MGDGSVTIAAGGDGAVTIEEPAGTMVGVGVVSICVVVVVVDGSGRAKGRLLA